MGWFQLGTLLRRRLGIARRLIHRPGLTYAYLRVFQAQFPFYGIAHKSGVKFIPTAIFAASYHPTAVVALTRGSQPSPLNRRGFVAIAKRGIAVTLL
jgi:hypothetical protein